MQTGAADKGTVGLGGWRKGFLVPPIQLSLRDLEASLQDPRSGEHVCSELQREVPQQGRGGRRWEADG